MTANEYALAYRGYFLRHNRRQEPFRDLYKLLWNTNAGKGHKINSDAELQRHWPLITDDKSVLILTEQSISDRLERALKLTRRLKGTHGSTDTSN